MTKFNQQRRLEDQHIAQKQQGIRSSKATMRSASTKSSPLSGDSITPKKPSRPFDVISSKIPRQQRTHATYRRESDEMPSSRTSSPVHSPRLPNSAPAALNTSPEGRTRQNLSPSSKAKCKKEGAKFAKGKASFKPEAQASAELMLQANAVLEELDRVQAAEAAAASAAAVAITSLSSGAVEPQPHSPAVSARQASPWSPFASRFKQSALPRTQANSNSQQPSVHSMTKPQANLTSQQHSVHSMAGTSASAGAAPSRRPEQLTRQHSRSFSMPGLQDKRPSPGVYSLSQTKAQLFRECHLDSPAATKAPSQSQPRSQPQDGVTSCTALLDIVKSKIQTHNDAAASDSTPAATAAQDTASLQTVSADEANEAVQHSSREACATSPQASAQTAQS